MTVKKTKKNENMIGKGQAGPGRPKGKLNKTTALLKDAILQAAQKAGGGGDDGMMNYLVAQADENPTAFMSLLGKVLPMQIANADGDDAFVVKAVVRRIV